MRIISALIVLISISACHGVSAEPPSRVAKRLVLKTDNMGFSGFSSITYMSEFFGYQSGISRDFTSYGISFAEQKQELVELPHDEQMDWYLIPGDVNSDGLCDLTGYEDDGIAIVRLRKPDGTLSEPIWSEVPPFGRCVIGDFDGDRRLDQATINWNNSGKVLYSQGQGDGHFLERRIWNPGLFDAQVAAGDFNGDGFSDICAYDGNTGSLRVYLRNRKSGFDKPIISSWNKPTGGQLVAADFNGDHYWDIALYGSKIFPNGFTFRFGRGNGCFGPTQKEKQSLVGSGYGTLWANYAWSVPDINAQAIAGNIDGDASADIGLYDTKSGFLYTRLQSDHPAYNYSVFMMKDGSIHRMYYGARCRTLDINGNSMPNFDGDHIASAWSKDGRNWFRRIDAPEFYKGEELGVHNQWWSNNVLEPEVLKVNGRYHMFWQVEIPRGTILDTGEEAVAHADRIGLSISSDGTHWVRKTDRGVIVNVPTAANLDHQEVIYVPDDPDGKPWWLYTFHFIESAEKKGQLVPAGHVRIRSSDPTAFDWNLRERTEGMGQLGNQIGYADEAPGGRMFFRISYTTVPDPSMQQGMRKVPRFELSRDGLHWKGSPATLAFTSDNPCNLNVQFLGFSTINGTGKMEYLGNNRFKAFYGATTCTTSVAPEIFHAKIGVGEVQIMFGR